jgi:hypothetical protein
LLHPSRVRSDRPDGGYVENPDVRSSYEAVWAPDGVLALSDESLPVIVAQRLHRLLSSMGDPDHLEGPKVVRYGPRQHYAEHHDFFSEPSRHPAGQRLATALVYLSSLGPDDGGRTVFPRAGGLKVAPQRGSALIWRNADADGAPDHDTLHGSEPLVPVEGSEKWVVNFFYRHHSYYDLALRAQQRSARHHAQPSAHAPPLEDGPGTGQS